MNTIPPKPANCLRIAHTADWHLRDEHLGLRKRGPDFTKAALAVVESACQNGCELIVNAGDILNVSRPSSQNITDLNAIHQRLKALGLPMLVISGNHDMASPSWSEAVLETDGKTGIIPADNLRHKQGGVNFTCLPWMPRAALVERLARVPDGDVLVWHGEVQEFRGYPGDSCVTVADLTPARFQAVLLGDIHKRGYVEATAEGAPCLVGYPGATEIVKRDDPLLHSYEIIDLPLDGSAPTHYQVMIETRPALVFHISSDADLEEVIAKVTAVADSEPMVFIRYAKSVEGVKARLHAAIDVNKVILREEPLPEVVLALDTPGQEGEFVSARQVTDFIPDLFPVPGPLQDLGALLCDPARNADDLINAYVAKRQEEAA
jgi:hypothetical protein